MVHQSMVKRTTEAKKNAAIAALSMKLAKDKGDILQKKAEKYKKLFIAAKQAIIKKYGPMARQEWVKQQSQNYSKKTTK